MGNCTGDIRRLSSVRQLSGVVAFPAFLVFSEQRKPSVREGDTGLEKDATGKNCPLKYRHFKVRPALHTSIAAMLCEP